MQIKRLKIIGLYGYINKDIKFNDDLTLLVGINGSGKTSVLNILNWVLKPSIPNLCVTEFKSIQLFLRFDESDVEIKCTHFKKSFTYNIIKENEKFSPLRVSLEYPINQIKNDETLKTELISAYSKLQPDTKEKKTWDLISSFPNPTVVGLDRHLYNEDFQNTYNDDPIQAPLIKKGRIQKKSPLDKVKDVVNTEYRKKKNSILNLTSNLKNHLMLSTFDDSISLKSITSGIKHKLELKDIEVAELRVNDYFLNFERKIMTAVEQKKITKYFSQLKEITQKYLSNPHDETTKFLYGLNANQFIKINALLKEFEDFEMQSKTAMQQIETYLSTLNFFFKDSAKELLFKEDTSDLTFNTLSKSKQILIDYKDISFLSSGEQQLLILFSYIAFNSEDGKIFIIDEPELSLHIKWQEDFLEQLERITPKGTQLIFATHSPILASKRKEKATVLLPYNS